MNITLTAAPAASVSTTARALRTAGAGLRITRDAGEIRSARKLVLPGVGSFVAAMRWLEENAIDIAIKRAVHGGASLLGICVGHQLLFDVSYEMGRPPGLGLVRGDVRKFEGPLPVPQIGWNKVTSSVLPNASYYFVNSYAVLDSPHAIARADYGGPFVAAVQKGRVFGVQF